MNKLEQPAEQAQGGFSQDAFTKYVNDKGKMLLLQIFQAGLPQPI
jgi:hypothetical protein